MYRGIPTQTELCPRLGRGRLSDHATDGEGYNVVIDVDRPGTLDDKDNAVIKLVDKFLKEHDENPIVDGREHHLPAGALRGAWLARVLRRCTTGISTR